MQIGYQKIQTNKHSSQSNIFSCHPSSAYMLIESRKRTGPILLLHTYQNIKDPCPVFDGKQWHMYGSGITNTEGNWQILHATAPDIYGPWTNMEPCKIIGIKGPNVAAPGVIYDMEDHAFHMFVQTDFAGLEGTIEHLISTDAHVFTKESTVLSSIPLTAEAGIYDPHPSVVRGEKVLCYSGMAQVSRPDIYLAISESKIWNGPWKRLGRILAHEDVPHHNQHGHHDYEWGLEGAQLLELPSGKLLLIGVCFLPEGERGTRQRVFFASANELTGPYRTLGTVLMPAKDSAWEAGENGHAAGIIINNALVLFYQARMPGNQPWQYGIAEFDIGLLEQAADYALSMDRHQVL
ncbi:MAG: hypothetical protein JWM56_1260 [Candidatus Peribacteria bacterium]|nr:hypothetical protein [Candidatus Peribacteria bacterium]